MGVKYATMSRLRLLRLLIVAGLMIPAAAVAGPGLQSSKQRSCLAALGKAGAKVSKAPSKVIRSCLKDAGRGLYPAGEGVQACMGQDPRGKVAKAQQKTEDQQARRCSRRPGFGYTGAPAVNSMALSVEIGLIRELIGGGIDAAVRESGPEAGCQSALFKRAAKVIDASWKDYNKCAKLGLKDGSISSRTQLDACIDTVKSTGSKTAKALGKLAAEGSSACAGLNISSTLPGSCSSGGLSTCLRTRLYCQACRMLADFADLPSDCDLFDDAVANSSCPGYPMVFENIRSLATTGDTYYVIPAEPCADDNRSGLAPDCSAGGNSGPWRTHTRLASASLKAGDAVEFGAGTYQLGQTTAVLAAVGTPSEPVRIGTWQNQVAVLNGGWTDYQSPGDKTPVLRIGSAYQYWKGLTIDGCNMVCIEVKKGSDHLVFEGNIVNGGGEDGIKATVSRLALYLDNEFTAFLNEAIDVWHTSHAWFVRNEFHHNDTVSGPTPSEVMWTKAGSENIHILSNYFHDLDMHSRALQLGGCCWANWADIGGLLCEGGTLDCDSNGDCCDCVGGQWVAQPIARQIYAIGNSFDAVSLGNPSQSAPQGVLGASACYDCEAAYNVVTDSDDAFSVSLTQSIKDQPCCGSPNCKDPLTGLCNRANECSYTDYPENVSFHDNIAIAIRQSASGIGGGNSARLWNAQAQTLSQAQGLEIDSNLYCVNQPVTCRIGSTSSTPMSFSDWQSQGFDVSSSRVDEASCPPLP